MTLLGVRKGEEGRRKEEEKWRQKDAMVEEAEKKMRTLGGGCRKSKTGL